MNTRIVVQPDKMTQAATTLQIAGVNTSPHDIRASAISNWIDTRAPIIQVQWLAGHASPATTERYYSRKQDLDSSPVYLVDMNTP